MSDAPHELSATEAARKIASGQLTAEALVHQHITVEAPPITNLRPAVPAEVAGTIARALAKAPADRFATASLLTEALKVPTTTPTGVSAGPRTS